MNRTEMRNPESMHIDTMSTEDMVALISRENRKVNDAVDAALPQIAEACDALSETVAKGGRVFYIGAGTSGRLGVCDAAECPPTYGVSPELFQGVIAGGLKCMVVPAENAEDSAEGGVKDLKERNFSGNDALVGISASGGAAYVVGAVEYANSLGAVTVSVTNNPDTRLEKAAKIAVVADTGEEVVTGSTRMKAGTAQKIILNMFSTVALIKNGNVYENLMINLKPSNIKLRGRMISIVTDILGCTKEEAEEKLEHSDWNIRKAVEK